MPERCCAEGCSQTRDIRNGIHMYRIPAEKKRRERWISAIKRENPDKSDWQPSKHDRLCSRHFASGEASTHPLHPDYVPSIFNHVPEGKKRKRVEDVDHFARRQALKERRVENSKKADAVQGLLNLCTTQETSSQETTQETSSPTPLGHCNSDSCKEYFRALEVECQSLRTENIELKEKLQNVCFEESSFIDNNEKVKAFTGLPSYTKLSALFTIVAPYLMKNSKLPVFQQFMLTLIRMKLDVTLVFLSYVFNISSSAASRIFTNTLDVMFARLVPSLVKWPERDQLRLTLPYLFRKGFKRCCTIIDCFEIFIEKPHNYLSRVETYSSYKSHNTMKYLIGITPQGTISYISTGWGGRTSDKHIVENSDFLNNILPGDLILADRGFNVADTVALFSAELQIPAFTKGKKQLDPVDLEKTRGLASVRIHVERVIGMTRQKYRILSNTIPVSLLESPDNVMMPLDKIVHVCCSLANVSDSVVPFG